MNQASLAHHLERAREGDPEAWGEVYRALAGKVFRLCRRVLPTREDAEDATVEIFLKAQLNLARYDPERPFEPWFYKLAANHCWDALRKSRGERESDGGRAEAESLESRDVDPLERLLAEESRHEVRLALARLGDRARLAVAMRYFAELSYEEIADVLGATPSLVGVLLLRARRSLRRILAERKP